MNGITIPVLGMVTAASSISAVVLLVLGYILGSQIKGAIKYMFAVVLIFAVLVVTGVIHITILETITQVVGVMVQSMNVSSFAAKFGSLSLPTIAFVGGFIAGMIKG